MLLQSALALLVLSNLQEMIEGRPMASSERLEDPTETSRTERNLQESVEIPREGPRSDPETQRSIPSDHPHFVEEEEGVIRRRADVHSASSVASTFHVESLDSPIERIEIRLIDGNVSHPHVDEVVVVLDGNTHRHTEDSNSVREEGRGNDGLPGKSADSLPEANYKKVEYTVPVSRVDSPINEDHSISTTIGPEIGYMQGSMTTEGAVEESMRNEDFNRLNPTSTLPSLPPVPAELDELTKEVDTLPPVSQKIIAPQEEEDPEPPEECLANRNLLSTEVVQSLEERANSLKRKIHRLNRQMHKHCRGESGDERDSFIQCPKWRDQKMVQYYKFMRVTYCENMENWPNSNRFKRTYAQHLPLFETLYTFNQQ